MAIKLTNPLPGGVRTDGFGWRPPIPAAGIYAWNFHNGTDLAAPAGTLIRAAHAGRVTGVFLDTEQGGGWMVRVGAAFGYTLYGHMRERSPLVRVGDEVKAGQGIGYVGKTGAATGNHLHWILNLNGTNVDPLPYLNATTQTGDTMTPEQARKLDVIYDTLTAGQAGVKSQGELHRMITQLPAKTTDAVFSRKFKRRGGTQKGETSLGAVVGWIDGMFETWFGKVLKK